MLGRFRVSVGPRIVDENRWRLKKAAGLVKLLALAPYHRMHRERVMDLLWPDLEAEAATNNLHRTLHCARRTLEPKASAAGESTPELARGSPPTVAGSGSLVTSSDCTTSLAGVSTGSTSYWMAAIARCANETRRIEDTRTACPAGETHSARRRSTPARRSRTRSGSRSRP